MAYFAPPSWPKPLQNEDQEELFGPSARSQAKPFAIFRRDAIANSFPKKSFVCMATFPCSSTVRESPSQHDFIAPVCAHVNVHDLFFTFAGTLEILEVASRDGECDMDFFVFQLAIIFLPGLVWERIVSKYGLKRPPTQFETALRTFTFGLTAYAVTYMLYAILGFEFYVPEVAKDSNFIADRKYVGEFVTALAAALAGSILWLYAYNRKLLGRFLRKIEATKKYGDEDVWDYVFSSADARVEYVYVRDYNNNKIFSGWVAGFSATDKVRELLLRNVQVYNLDGQPLYEMPLMYVSRPADAMDVEFPVTR